jgi:tetratricopeptide (TPR) repeat protein/DNA-binding SARP family transcriptional activator
VEINFRIVGSTALRIGGRFDRQWAQPKPRGMLAALLLRPDQPVTVDELIAWMWPDDKIPQYPKTTLYQYTKRIREALERMENPPPIRVSGGTYRIEVNPAEIDYFAFRNLLENAASLRRQGDQAGATLTLVTALGLWNDRALADLQTDQARDWRVAAEQELVIPAHADLLLGLCAAGEFDEVLRRMSDLPMEYRTNLALVKCRLEALRGSHQHQLAIKYYLDQRKRLLADFDHDSAAELTRFHNQLTQRQQVIADLPASAPRLLPHDMPDFIGREELFTHLDMITTTPAVALLTGEPGVGKTALALRWVHHNLERFPGGQLYVDLNGFGTGSPVQPPQVVERFLGAMGHPAEQTKDDVAVRVSLLRSLLSGRRIVVILDNAADSAQVKPLLDCLSACSVLVTSRQRLNGLRAATVPVTPFGYTEAKRMLMGRLRQRAADEQGAVGQLAALCGGFPMALRLVAEHVMIRPRVPLAEFAEELRDAYEFLGLGGSDDSIRAAFDHSYRSLGQADQRMFRLLGLNPGSDISLNAAAALCGQDRTQTRRSLDALVDAHLLGQPETRDRYRFHDLIRKYARERSAEHKLERAAGGERLLSYYLHSTNRADKLAFPGRDEVPMLPLVGGVIPASFADADSAIRWIVRERANLNAIVRYAAANDFHEYASRLPSVVGEILMRLGHFGEAISALEVAVQSARETRDVGREAASLGNLGYLYLTLHDLTKAEEYFRPAKEKCDEVGDVLGSAINDHRLGRLQIERGEFRKGIETQLAALHRVRTINAPSETIIFLYRLAEAYRRAGNFEAAVSYCEESLTGAWEIGDRRSEVLCLIQLALTHYGRGDLTAARRACDRGLTLGAEIHETSQFGRYLALQAQISHDRGQHHEAEHFSRLAVTRSRGAGDVRSEAVALDILADVLHAQARHDEAIEAWSRALTLFNDFGDPRADSVRARLAEYAAFPSTIPNERTEPLPGRSPLAISSTPDAPSMHTD